MSVVKWVVKYELFDYPSKPKELQVPVIPLTDLAEVVEYLREQVRYHDPLCMDNIEEDGCTCGHATAQRILTQLEAMGKEG